MHEARRHSRTSAAVEGTVHRANIDAGTRPIDIFLQSLDVKKCSRTSAVAEGTECKASIDANTRPSDTIVFAQKRFYCLQSVRFCAKAILLSSKCAHFQDKRTLLHISCSRELQSEKAFLRALG